MKKYVIDTQALVKFMNGVKVISTAVDQILKKADAGENITAALLSLDLSRTFSTSREILET